MSLRVEFLSGADNDLQAIFNRCEDYREGFGVEFMTAVDAYLARIAVFHAGLRAIAPCASELEAEPFRRQAVPSHSPSLQGFFTAKRALP